MQYRKTWGLLAAYAGTSYYFLKHPEKLHMRKTKTVELMSGNKMQLFAHRGGSIESPENTMQAFKMSN